MSILKCVIYLCFFYSIFSQNNFPMMPNPGYDSITVHPVFDMGNKNSSQTPTKHKKDSTSKIMTNGSITVNTTNMDPQCNLECYTGCRVLFPEFVEQKYCIINVCKCQIIEKEVTLPENVKNNSANAQRINSEMHKYSTTAFINLENKYKNTLNINDNLKNKESTNFYWIFYLLIFAFSFGYEYYILNYISEKNDFSIVNWINEKKDIQFKKYRFNNEDEFDNTINNDELRKCLL